MPETTSPNSTLAETAAELERESIETARLQRELARSRQSLNYLNNHAESHDSNALRMRQIAARLTNEIQPLRTVFTPLRQLHTSHTWEGQAATASRRRLDQHEIRHTAAIRGIDRLIDDLETTAQWHAAESAELSTQINNVRWAIQSLERQL